MRMHQTSLLTLEITKFKKIYLPALNVLADFAFWKTKYGLTNIVFNTIIFAYVKGDDGTSNFSEVSRERSIWWKLLI